MENMFALSEPPAAFWAILSSGSAHEKCGPRIKMFGGG